MPTTSRKTPPSYTAPASIHWYVFLFVVGAASTAVEVIGLRLLAPLFGSSLPVWGSVIAVVLGGLAWGYAHGGKRAQRGATTALVARHGLAAGTLFLLLPLLFRGAAWLRDLALYDRAALPLVGALALAALSLLAPSIVFGMVTPLAVQAEAVRRQEAAGRVAGRISALTTLGSLVGILIPSFVTIPLFGTRASVWLFCGTVLAVGFPLTEFSRKAAPYALVLALGMAGSFVPLAEHPATIFATETAQQHVTVSQHDTVRVLQYDAGLGVQSVYTDAPYTRGYWDYLAALPALLPEAHTEISVLVLGAAASTTERQLQRWWHPEKTFTFTSVEIDGALFPIADTYFDPPQRHTVTADARVFVAGSREQYDIIVLDAYAKELTVPFHLVTAEFFETVASRLAPGGLLAVNANAASADTLWIRSLTTTLRTAFPVVRISHVPDSCNYLLLAGRKPWPESVLSGALPSVVTPLLSTLTEARSPSIDGWVLTDDRAPTDLLGVLAFSARAQAAGCGG